MLQTKIKENPITDITLAKYKLWTIDGDRRGDVVTCLNGTLWITQKGDLKDYVLETGRSFWVTRPGTVVVQALDDAQFKYSLNELRSHVEINLQPVHQSYRSRLSHLLR